MGFAQEKVAKVRPGHRCARTTMPALSGATISSEACECAKPIGIRNRMQASGTFAHEEVQSYLRLIRVSTSNQLANTVPKGLRPKPSSPLAGHRDNSSREAPARIEIPCESKSFADPSGTFRILRSPLRIQILRILRASGRVRTGLRSSRGESRWSYKSRHVGPYEGDVESIEG